MTELPQEGVPWKALEQQLSDAKKGDVAWRDGRAPALVHFAGDDVLEVAKRAYLMYFSENGLGPRAFKSLAGFESDVVAMGLRLLHGTESARGAMTTGGTESIFLAVKAARDFAAARGSASAGSHIVLPYSAHPAFDKAAHFLGVKTVRVPLRADFTADPVAMQAAVTPDTIMIVGSAPAYPHGVMDPIGQLAAIASERGLWLHVDACVGGYIAPFAQQLGADVPPFAFDVPGVRSISADLHKYGYAAKGASTLFFADPESFAHMAWSFDSWPRGQYKTHTLVGTRAGGAIAAAWAVMHFLGVEGYLRITERVLATRRALEEGVRSLGLKVLGKPELSIIAYGSDRLDMGSVGASLAARGWFTGYVNDPPGIHLMLNLTHEPVIPQYIDDLAAAVRDAKPASAGSSVAAIY